MSFQAAASIMSSGTDPVSRHAEAAAGYLVADFCALTRDQPTSVCSQVPSSLTGISASPGKGVSLVRIIQVGPRWVPSIVPTSDRRPTCAAARDQPRSIKRAGER